MSAFQSSGAAGRLRINTAQTNTDGGEGAAAAAARPPISPSLGGTRQRARVLLRVFLPFTAAFFLAYLFRSINALIASDLSAELGLDAADMGLLTSVYFLTFAALQLPVGIWLDRYGPRRVEAALLLFAAAGSLLFAIAGGFAALTLGRAFIGLGVAAAFTAGVKANAQWFPKDRSATMNGYLLMLGALGALSATTPARMLLDWSGGWRGLFAILAAATVACAVMIWIVVPEATAAGSPHAGPQPSLKVIYRDPRFWRVAPLSAMCAGTAWAVQSLWAAPWLTDVDHLPRAEVTGHLFAMAVALSIAALLLGAATDRLSRHGIGPQILLGFAATMVIAAQLALILRWPLPSYVSWSIVAAAGSTPVVSYAILAECFPKEVGGRANGALNLLHFGGAFAVQYLIGVILVLWPSRGGHYPATAYQIAFGLNLCLQAMALAWFALPFGRGRGTMMSDLGGLVFGHGGLALALGPRHRPAAGRSGFIAAEQRASLWQHVGLGSAGLTALLGLSLAISVVRANVMPVIMTARRDEPFADLPKVETTLPDAQIAYALAEFVKEVRSLSADPVVVRTNWSDALDHVTARAAQTLNAYVRADDPFTKIGRRTVTVLVTNVVRVAGDTFEIRWQEEIVEGNVAVRHERFVATISVVRGAAGALRSINRNPLGLYVDRFTWSREP